MEQLTRQQFGVLVKAMKAVYAQPTFIPDQDAFNTWYMLLQDIPYPQLNIGVQLHMQSSRFPPTVADLRAAATKITAPGDQNISELEAWAVVRKAICRSGYYSQEEFDKLPPLVQKAVGKHENLREWALMEVETVGSVIQSQFLRSYRQVLQRHTEVSSLSPALQEAMNAAGIEEKTDNRIGYIGDGK